MSSFIFTWVLSGFLFSSVLITLISFNLALALVQLLGTCLTHYHDFELKGYRITIISLSIQFMSVWSPNDKWEPRSFLLYLGRLSCYFWDAVTFLLYWSWNKLTFWLIENSFLSSVRTTADNRTLPTHACLNKLKISFFSLCNQVSRDRGAPKVHGAVRKPVGAVNLISCRTMLNLSVM